MATSEITVSFELVDAVSPVLKALSTIVESGLLGLPQESEVAIPFDPVMVAVPPGSTKAVLLPSISLLSLLMRVSQVASEANEAAKEAALPADYRTWLSEARATS